MSITRGRTKFRSYTEARAFAHTLNLTSSEAWFEFCAYGERPSDIPSNPQVTYHLEWQGWRDWLGTGQIRNAASKRYTFLPFEEARDFARQLRLPNKTEWRAYCASGKRPRNIPSSPQVAYRSRWKNWGDWLGTGYTKNSFLPYDEARTIVRGLGLKSRSEYYAAARSGCDHRVLARDVPQPRRMTGHQGT